MWKWPCKKQKAENVSPLMWLYSVTRQKGHCSIAHLIGMHAGTDQSPYLSNQQRSTFGTQVCSEKINPQLLRVVTSRGEKNLKPSGRQMRRHQIWTTGPHSPTSTVSESSSSALSERVGSVAPPWLCWCEGALESRAAFLPCTRHDRMRVNLRWLRRQTMPLTVPRWLTFIYLVFW